MRTNARHSPTRVHLNCQIRHLNTGGLQDCMSLTLGEDMHVLNGLMLMKKAWLLSLIAEAGSKLTLSAVANVW